MTNTLLQSNCTQNKITFLFIMMNESIIWSILLILLIFIGFILNYFILKKIKNLTNHIFLIFLGLYFFIQLFIYFCKNQLADSMDTKALIAIVAINNANASNYALDLSKIVTYVTSLRANAYEIIIDTINLFILFLVTLISMYDIILHDLIFSKEKKFNLFTLTTIFWFVSTFIFILYFLNYIFDIESKAFYQKMLIYNYLRKAPYSCSQRIIRDFDEIYTIRNIEIFKFCTSILIYTTFMQGVLYIDFQSDKFESNILLIETSIGLLYHLYCFITNWIFYVYYYDNIEIINIRNGFNNFYNTYKEITI